MPHISPRKLEQKVLKEIIDKLYSTLRSADHRAMAVPVFQSLTTPTEKIMFAKRLMLVLLISKGALFEEIEAVLKVSPTTISKFSLAFENGEFNQLLKVCEKTDLANSLEKLLRAGLPALGKGRWDFLKE